MVQASIILIATAALYAASPALGAAIPGKSTPTSTTSTTTAASRPTDRTNDRFRNDDRLSRFREHDRYRENKYPSEISAHERYGTHNRLEDGRPGEYYQGHRHGMSHDENYDAHRYHNHNHNHELNRRPGHSNYEYGTHDRYAHQHEHEYNGLHSSKYPKKMSASEMKHNLEVASHPHDNKHKMSASELKHNLAAASHPHGVLHDAKHMTNSTQVKKPATVSHPKSDKNVHPGVIHKNLAARPHTTSTRTTSTASPSATPKKPNTKVHIPTAAERNAEIKKDFDDLERIMQYPRSLDDDELLELVSREFYDFYDELD